MDEHEKVNILLVDDQPGKLLTYEAILGDMGETLIRAGSAREALDTLLRTDVAVMLVDVCMPELDGFELATMIREHPRFQKTAIILVSAILMSEVDLLKGYQRGAVDYVPVPIVPEILRAKVAVFADLWRKTRKLERWNQELEQRVSERTAELEATATRLRANEESLRAAMDALRDTDRRKDEFLAVLAHELRNPLAPVSSAVEIMQFPDVDEERMAWCRDVIARQVSHLTRLVDDLLDVSRITRGKIKLRLETLDLHAVIAAAAETSRPGIEGHQHQLEVQLPRGPLRVHGDSVRLTQVVANLLNNAAKYQQDGGRIHVSAAREGAEVVIRVRDRGIGMPPEILSRIFEPFIQADQSLHRSQGGLGVGLSLVRSLVQLHGGSVHAHSEGTDRGSELEVRLPACDGVPEEAAPDEPAVDGAQAAHRASDTARPTA
ncbi:MAG TPA: hybrid sensor histidine kinase/response regulator [Planctomycetota bacterium]|nr:hybrid sensor histidine kinase/response regulator [Planctomycetota bacterium]